MASAQAPGTEKAKTAYKLLKNKDYAGALDNINQAITLEPANSQYYFIKGVTQMQMKNLSAAKASFQQAIEKDKSNGRAYQMMARIALKENNNTEAIRLLNEAFQNETAASKKIQYKLIVSNLLSRNGQYAQALTELDNIRPLASGDARVPYAEAKVYEKMEKWSEAAAKYKQALDQMGNAAPQSLKDKYNTGRAIALFKSGNKAEAEKIAAEIKSQNYRRYYTKVTKLSGARIQLYYANPYIKVGDYEEAMKYIQRAIEAGDQPGLSNLFAAQVYSKQGQTDQAISYLNAALNTEKDSSMLKRVAAMLVNLQFRNGDYSGTISTARSLLNRNPNNDKVLFLKAQAEYQGNRFAEATSTLQQALGVGGVKPADRDKYNFLLGLAAQKNGDDQMAKEALGKVSVVKSMRAAAKKLLNQMGGAPSDGASAPTGSPAASADGGGEDGGDSGSDGGDE